MLSQGCGLELPMMNLSLLHHCLSPWTDYFVASSSLTQWEKHHHRLQTELDASTSSPLPPDACAWHLADQYECSVAGTSLSIWVVESSEQDDVEPDLWHCWWCCYGGVFAPLAADPCPKMLSILDSSSPAAKSIFILLLPHHQHLLGLLCLSILSLNATLLALWSKVRSSNLGQMIQQPKSDVPGCFLLPHWLFQPVHTLATAQRHHLF